MDRRAVAVLALALLATAAAARPSDNHIRGNLSNEINGKQLMHTKSLEVTTDGSLCNVTRCLGDEKAALAQPKTTKSINELYPYAVLFGGTCGGTIISPNWILTAAHCTLFTGGRYVLAGTSNSEDDSGVVRHVKRLIVHPLFSVGPYWLDADKFHINQVAAHYDFMLAELEEPLPLDGRTIVTAELDDQLSLPDGLEVGYAGYGAAHHGETMRHEMHGMELLVLDNRKCEGLVQFNSSYMICTQGRPPRFDSACNGDSGSGLVANGKVYGVASWVQDDAKRCFNGALVVFSRVGAVRDWIRQVTSI